MVGQRIGPYEIVAKVGEGGMGEVYRATDTKLKRQVAIKILPAAVAADPDRLARFQREAEVLASLNHPNIAHIHGLEGQAGQEGREGTLALVMELVEGEDLAQRIARGPIPLHDALPIAKQIAEALEAAHEQGIVHRDLKPANVKVKVDGTVKVLDFGLAKALDQSPASGLQSPASALSMSPTLTSPALMTGAGLILGTAAYMAPEQARGRTVDRRADIWAFGCVLYEMLTAARPFDAEDISGTLAYVITKEPDWNALPPATPQVIRRLLRRCLEKDPKRRLQAIGDARLEMDEALSGGDASSVAATVASAPAPPKFRAWPWVAVTATLAAVAAGTSFVAYRATRPVERPLMRFSDDLEPALTGNAVGPAVAISPDGDRLAYVSRGQGLGTHISVRRLDDSAPVDLPGTDGGDAPFFSPDGRWIGFFTQGALKKTSVEGGAAVTITPLGFPPRGGGFWADDDTILYAGQRTPVMRVSANGGTPAAVTQLDESKREVSNRAAQVVPGGDAILFTASADNNAWEDATIYVQSLKGGERKLLVNAGYFGRYIHGSDPSSGHLLYVHDDTLFAAPMDVAHLALTGVAIPVLQDVSTRSANGLSHLAFTRAGMLAYVVGAHDTQSVMYWWDASGNAQPISAPPASYSFPRISPDGSRVAVRIDSTTTTALGVYEWAQNRMMRLGSISGVASRVVWAPDGKHIVVALTSQSAGGPGIYWLRADGAGTPQRILDGVNLSPSHFAADGKRLLFARINGGETSIATLSLNLSDPEHPKPGKPETFLAETNATTSVDDPAFSPDGRWIAYTSAESGQREVYVRPFPAPGGKWQVSTTVGGVPMWSPNGHELFYEQTEGAGAGGLTSRVTLMVVPYTVNGDAFVPGQPRAVSPTSLPPYTGRPWLDLAPDGKRFIGVMPASAEGAQHAGVTFLLNFADELRRKVPAKQ